MRQLEIKEEVYIVDFDTIGLYYKFADGRIMPKRDYDEQVWIDSAYEKEDFYYSPVIGDNYFIRSQEKIVKTIEEAEEFQRQQRIKLINKKQKTIEKLKGEIISKNHE